MSSKAPQLPPKNAQRPPAPPPPPPMRMGTCGLRESLGRLPASSARTRIEALEQIVRQEQANALYWHDKYAATLPTTEPRRGSVTGHVWLIFSAAMFLFSGVMLAGLVLK